MSDFIKLPKVQGVAPGSKFTLEIPVGLTYEKLQARVTWSGLSTWADVLGWLQNLEFKLNGDVFRRHKTGTRVDLLNAFYNVQDDNTANEGFLTFWFNRPWLNELADQRATAIGTADVDTFTLEGEVDAGAPADIKIEFESEVRSPEPLGAYVNYQEFGSGATVVGENEFSDLPRKNREHLAVHFMKADANAVTVEANYGTGDRKIYGKTTKASGENHQSRYGRVPQSGSATHIDYTLQNDIVDGLDTDPMKSLMYKVDLGSVGNFDIVLESLVGFVGNATGTQ